MAGPQPTLGRQREAAQPTALATEPEPPFEEVEPANSLLAGMIGSGLEWLIDLLLPDAAFFGPPAFGTPGFGVPSMDSAKTAPSEDQLVTEPPATRLTPALLAPHTTTEPGSEPLKEAPASGLVEEPAGTDVTPGEADQADITRPRTGSGLGSASVTPDDSGGAPVTDGGPIGTWQAKVQSATSRVKPGKLTGGRAESVAKVGRNAVEKRHQQAGKLADEAKQTVPKPAKTPDLPPFPDDQTQQAIAKLDPKLGRTLRSHTLPDLQSTPGGHLPQIDGPVAPVLSPDAADRARIGQAAHRAVDSKQPDKDPASQGKKVENTSAADAAAMTAEQHRGRGRAAGATVVAEAPELAGDGDIVHSKVDVSALVARLLADPEKHADRIVRDARQAGYEGRLQKAWPEVGADLVPGERALVDQELRRVGDAVGVSGQALNEKIARSRTQLSTQGQLIKADVNLTLATARAEVTTADSTLTDTIALWHSRIDGQVEERAAAVRGDVDLAKVRADRERLVSLINTRSGQGVVAYQAVAQKLKAALRGEIDKQRRAYRHAAALDEQDLQATNPDAAQARVAYRPTGYWLEERMGSLRTFSSTAEREIDNQADTFVTELNDAATHARDEIREWAAQRIGYERSWLQKILDRVADWVAQSQVQTAAWARRRAAEAAAQVDKDMQFLQEMAENQRLMTKQELQREYGSLRADQAAILNRLFASEGQDVLGALAEGMITRLSMQRREPLLRVFDAKAIELGYDQRTLVWATAVAESPNLSPFTRADRLHDAFKGPGTTEREVFAALDGLTPLGGHAVRFAYRDAWQEDLDKRLDEELNDALTWSSHDIDRATALLVGTSAEAVAVELHQAMHGNWNGLDLGGTDEDTIFAALRNKTPDEIAAIKQAYKTRYGKDLQAEVKGELHEGWVAGAHDEERGQALLNSDTALADVIALDQAMHGGLLGLGLGTNRKALEEVYLTNDRELEAEADSKAWDSAELTRKKAERRRLLDEKYLGRYHRVLSAEFEDEMSGADLNLISGLREQDWNKVDAARIALEHDSILYADDVVINNALQGRFTRKYSDNRRDLNLAIDEAMRAAWTKVQAASPDEYEAAVQKYHEEWSPEKTLARRKQAAKDARVAAAAEAKENFPKLEEAYDTAYKGKTSLWGYGGTYRGLRADVAHDTQLVQGEKAQALIAGQGTLSETQEITYAVKGLGTDNDIVRDIFAGKNADEMADLGEKWEKENPGKGSFKNYVLDDFSARQYHEVKEQIEHGEAETPQQKAARAKRLLDFENSGWFDFGSRREKEVMQERYQRLEDDSRAFAAQEQQKGQPGYDWVKHADLAGQANSSAMLFESAVTSHRKSVDVVSDTVVQVIGAVITAIVITASIAADIATLGGATAATPAVIAFLGTMWGAITASAVGLGLTMLTKRAFLGEAYGGEDAWTDLGVGLTDMATMGLTAKLGMATRMLKGSKLLLALFSKGKLGKLAARGIVEGAEGMVQAAPGALLGNVVDPANFGKGDNAILNVLIGTTAQIAQAGVMSAGTSMLRGSVQVDLIRMRIDSGYQNDVFKRYQAKNPGKTRSEFMHGLDNLITTRTDLGFDDPRLQDAMRSRLLEHIPADQRATFANVPIEVVPAEQFVAFGQNDRGTAVTVIRNGEPVVVLRGGSQLSELAFEGPHLQQVRDPKNAARVTLLDEQRMQRWDSLSLAEQAEAYRTKVELEVEAHEQILHSLEAQKGQGLDTADWAEAREKTQQNLAGLRKQLAEVQTITPQRRAAIATGRLTRPAYLNRPARLFSMDPGLRLAAKSGPAVPAAVDRQRKEVIDLRKEIAGLEAREAKRGKLNSSEARNLEVLRARLHEQYRPVPEELQPAQNARLLDQQLGESLSAYHERLKGMRAEVNLHAEPENKRLAEAYETELVKTAADMDEVRKLRADLAAVSAEDIAKSAALNENMEAMSRATGEEFGKLRDKRFELLNESAILNARRIDRTRTIDALERRGSLFFGDKPWHSVPLVDSTNPNIKNRVGLVGELEASANARQRGLEPKGDTVNAEHVKSRESFEGALEARQGKQGIDGIFQGVEGDATVYELHDTKTTADPKPTSPTGAGKLKSATAASGKGERQLSREWIDHRLGKSGLTPQELRNIRAGLKSPGKPVSVVQDDGSVKIVIVRKVYAQVYRDSTGVLRTRLYLVEDVSDIDVRIIDRYQP